jgi:hypothetical protein
VKNAHPDMLVTKKEKNVFYLLVPVSAKEIDK